MTTGPCRTQMSNASPHYVLDLKAGSMDAVHSANLKAPTVRITVELLKLQFATESVACDAIIARARA